MKKWSDLAKSRCARHPSTATTALMMNRAPFAGQGCARCAAATPRPTTSTSASAPVTAAGPSSGGASRLAYEVMSKNWRAMASVAPKKILNGPATLGRWRQKRSCLLRGFASVVRELQDMMSAKCMDCLTPSPCPHLDMIYSRKIDITRIYSIKLMQPPLLSPLFHDLPHRV